MLLDMINSFRKKWEDEGLVILVVASIIFLCIYALFRIGHTGTYLKYEYNPLWMDIRPVQTTKRQPSRDSAGEIICREYLQNRFGKPFSKIRPDFLKNNVTGGYNLELDCYNPELGIAVEYNGVQHYKYTPYFHRNKEAFLNQKYRDEMKRERCRLNNIHLIEVPYTVKKESIEGFLDSELVKLGF